MRFIHVNHRYAPFVGGSERYMQEVSEALAGDGHSVSVLASNAFDLEYFWDATFRRVDAPAAETLAGVDVHRVEVKHFPQSPLVFQGSRRAMGELSRLHLPSATFEHVSRRLPHLPGLQAALERAAPADLVHGANVGLEGLALHAWRASRRMNVPFVLTPFIHLGRQGDAIAKRYVSMPHQKSLMQAAQSIIVMTQIEASFVKSLGVDASKIHVSGVGVLPSEVSGGSSERFRQKFGLTGRLVGVASAVAPDKGSVDLVLAVAALRRRGHDVQLVLAGPRLGAFDRWFDSLDSAEREGVHLPGFISPQDKRDMLAALDVLTMPSRTESFGIAYLEGWANGRPVLAANAGAVPELVQHEVNGLLVEFGDVQAIAAGIDELLSNSEKAHRLGQAGKLLTLGSYTWPLVLDRVMKAYSHALGFDIGKGV